MEIRLLTREELNRSLDLVWKVLCDYEAVNYTEYSKRVFMEYMHFLDLLQDKNDEVAYTTAKRIAAESELSDKYYKYIPEFAKLLNHQKSYLRTRAMILCCSQARWDNEGVIAKYLPQMLKLVHDEKPTVVRQSLNALKEVVAFRPELCKAIAMELKNMNIPGYKDSMIGLIQKDVTELKELMN